MNYDAEMWKTLYDAAGKRVIPGRVKILGYLRILAIGGSFDGIDDSAPMGRRTIRTYLHQFCRDVSTIYGGAYLNAHPTT